MYTHTCVKTYIEWANARAPPTPNSTAVVRATLHKAEKISVQKRN